MNRTSAGQRTPAGRSPVVFALIGINLLVFALLNLFPKAQGFLLLAPETWGQAPWTLVTVFFSHLVLFHLVSNMALVFFFGRALAERAGGGSVLLTYLLSGLAGSMVTVFYAGMSGWTEPTVGASAAAFGIVASYAALEPQSMILKGKASHWVLALFMVNIALTIMSPELSIGGPAHAVGILVGYGLGRLVRRRPMGPQF